MVISQFSQFCVITAHISAERHLSKISYENFYSPWPPLSFKTIIIFHAKPFFTSAQGPTVKGRNFVYALLCIHKSLIRINSYPGSLCLKEGAVLAFWVNEFVQTNINLNVHSTKARACVKISFFNHQRPTTPQWDLGLRNCLIYFSNFLMLGTFPR